MTIVVTRHAGAIDWLRNTGTSADCIVPHLDILTVSTGDVVIGTLPVNLIAEVCTRGARYVHLAVNIPFELRGQELSAGELESAGAQLQEYLVHTFPFQGLEVSSSD